jgi:hypothetical protein
MPLPRFVANGLCIYDARCLLYAGRLDAFQLGGFEGKGFECGLRSTCGSRLWRVLNIWYGPLAGMVSVGSSVPAQCLLYAGPRSYSQYSTSWSDHLMTSPLRFEFMVSEM